jgi:hypothetical protein
MATRVEALQFATRSKAGNWAYAFCLTGIGMAAAAVRIIYVATRWNNPVATGFDQYWYQNLASLIAKGKGISSPTAYVQKGVLVPTALHLPLTSFLLVPFDLAGFTSLGGHQVLMALAGVATVIILGLLAGRLVSRGAGLVTAIVAALYPGLWGFDAKVMSEPVEQLLVALMLLFAYGFRNRPTATRAVCLGVIVGLGILTRSELLLEVPLLLIPICIGAFRGRFTREFGIKAALMLGSTAIVLAPWVAYCQTAFHDPEVLSTDLGVGLINDNNPVTYYGARIGFWYAPAASPTPPGDESQVDHTFQHEAEAFAKSHKRELPAVVLARVGRLWDVYNPFQTARFTALPAACPPQVGCLVDSVEDLHEIQAWIWSFYGLLPFAVVGLVVLRRRRVILYPLLSLAVIVTVVAVFEAGVLRFRAPFEDAFVIMAGIGLHAVLNWSWRRVSPLVRSATPTSSSSLHRRTTSPRHRPFHSGNAV